MFATRYWNELTTEELANVDRSKIIAVLPISATEQHGPHLPLGMRTFDVSWFRFPWLDDLYSAEEQVHGIHGGAMETDIMTHLHPNNP